MALLRLKSITKHFGAIEALNGVDLEIEPGEVVGLMGDNGAGKSTLVKIIAGNFPPSAGEIVLDDETVHFHKPVEARAKGIEVVYQDLALCDNLTAAANVFLGRELSKRHRAVPRPRLSRDVRAGRRAVRGAASPRRGRAIWCARCRAASARRSPSPAPASSEAKIVLMDEPTAAISVRQVAEVLDLIRRLRDQGIAVVLISHRMPDVFAVCRPRRRAAPRPQGRRQADRDSSSPEEVTGLITGAIHAA